MPGVTLANLFHIFVNGVVLVDRKEMHIDQNLDVEGLGKSILLL